jgi:N-acetylglucosamine-6-phosphate deacetylase
MTIKSISARTLITSTGRIDYPEIAIDSDGIIASIIPGEPNASDTILTSTFFDIHIHGAAGHDTMEATPQAFSAIGKFLATKGVTNYLATTVTAPIDATLNALEGIANAIDAPLNATSAPAARAIGIHLEGPFISHAKRGAHPPTNLQPPSIALFDRLQQAARGHIRLITIAPETPGALDLIEYVTKSGIKVSLGHSNATAAETRAAIAAGATSATHTFNAMRPLDHREPGIAGVVLDARSLYAELICDGIHVAPELIRLWLRAKGPDRAILITDSISATGMPGGNYRLGEIPVTVANGRCLLTTNLANGVETLAGSLLTMDRAVANLRHFTGASLATAVHLASRNPAHMLGLTHLTEIAPGRPANFNVFSADGTFQQTILLGRPIRTDAPATF